MHDTIDFHRTFSDFKEILLFWVVTQHIPCVSPLQNSVDIWAEYLKQEILCPSDLDAHNILVMSYAWQWLRLKSAVCHRTGDSSQAQVTYFREPSKSDRFQLSNICMRANPQIYKSSHCQRLYECEHRVRNCPQNFSGCALTPKQLFWEVTK